MLPFVQVWSAFTADAVTSLPVAVIGQVLAAATLWAASHTKRRFWMQVILGGIAAVMAGSAYVTLVGYPRFWGYAPFILATVVLWGLQALPLWISAGLWREGKLGSAWLSIGAGGVNLAAVVALTYANHALYVGYYRTLHAYLFEMSFLSLQASLLALSLIITGKWRRLFGVAAGACAAGAVMLPVWSLVVATPPELQPYLQTLTQEQGPGGDTGTQGFRERPCSNPPPTMGEDEARRVFLEASGLGDGRVDLSQASVLLITVETMRYDQTSFASPAYPTTSSLTALRDRGAWVFHRAYSPSSRTLHAVSALQTLTLPSFAPVRMDHRDWCGELGTEAPTVAEIFSAAGYGTFRVAYHPSDEDASSPCFRGLDRGFEVVEPVGMSWKSAESLEEADTEIAQRTIEAVKRSVAHGRPFFGWSFFVSTHTPYAPASSVAEPEMVRYRRALAHVDEQIGRIVDYLSAAGLLGQVVLVITGDHGEEFGEHGGRYHNTTLYDEVVRVPLVVWVPGWAGNDVHQPVSTGHVLPWVMLHGKPSVAEGASTRIQSHLGPALAATDGAVIVERVGQGRLLVAIVDERYKLIQNLRTGRTELFDLEKDPYERANLIGIRPDVLARMNGKMNRFMDVRACRHAYGWSGM
jgi:arylsulfatase A-like enzyme